MAQVDVTQLLSDPTFTDPVTIVHRTSTIDTLGQNQLTEQNQCTIGSVQPASGKVIQRLPDDMRVGDVRSFFVKGQIISDGKTAYPDILIFCGQRFEVQLIFPWTNWGAGWCEGTCVRERAA